MKENCCTCIHGNKREGVFSLFFAVQRFHQRDLSGRRIDHEKSAVALLLQEVPDLPVERLGVRVVRPNGQDVAVRRGDDVFHDVSRVRGVQKRRGVVVDVGDGDGNRRCVVANFRVRTAVFRPDGQRVARFPFEIEVFRDPHDAGVFADRKVPVFVTVDDRVPDSTIQTFIDIRS